MASLDDLSTNDKIVGGTAAALIISLLFLPWHNVDLGIISASRTAVQSPNGFYGVLALLITIAVLARLVMAKFTSTELPTPPMPWGQLQMFAAIAVLVLLVLKLVVETEYLGFGAYVSILLAAGLTYGAVQASKEPSSTV